MSSRIYHIVSHGLSSDDKARDSAVAYLFDGKAIGERQMLANGAPSPRSICIVKSSIPRDATCRVGKARECLLDHLGGIYMDSEGDSVLMFECD